MNARKRLASSNPSDMSVAIASGDVSQVKLFFKAGLLRPDQMLVNQPALEHAITGGNLEMITLFLDAGARLETKCHVSECVFSSFCVCQRCNFDLYCWKGWTPLGLALKLGNMETVALLLERKANVEATNEYGWSPLGFAVERDDVELVRLLLKYHASPTAVFCVGPVSLSPLDYARDKRKVHVEAVLEEWIATHKDAPPPPTSSTALDFLENGAACPPSPFLFVL